MTKKINFRKIETTIPYDAFISKINGLGRVKNVTLDVNVVSKKVYELDDAMFVLLNIFDSSGELPALLVGNRDADFQTLVQNIRFGLKYRIAGNVSMIDDSLDEYQDLPFRNEISGDKVFCIYALQNYNHTTFGIDMDEFHSCMDLEEQYNVIAKYTNYLNDIPVDMVEDIMISCYQEVVVLLKDGTAFINGKKILDDVKYITLIDIRTICAIGAEKTITCLTEKGRCGHDFINDNNYHYKKIVFTEFGIAALTHEKTVKYYGDFNFGAIDYSRFVDVDDIGLIGDSDDIIVVKGDKVYSLFLYSPTVNVSDINVEDYLHGRWII